MDSGTLSANGSTATVTTTKQNVVFAADGTFGSGTMTAEVNVSGTWITLGAITADGSIQVAFPHAVEVRWTLSGATGPTINWVII